VRECRFFHLFVIQKLHVCDTKSWQKGMIPKSYTNLDEELLIASGSVFLWELNDKLQCIKTPLYLPRLAMGNTLWGILWTLTLLHSARCSSEYILWGSVDPKFLTQLHSTRFSSGCYLFGSMDPNTLLNSARWSSECILCGSVDLNPAALYKMQTWTHSVGFC